MPSSVLDKKIPHSILFPHDPLHSLPPKVFGSTCFVHSFSPGLDKLSPKSHKCVFLGFTISQKGYKCFPPSLNRYFILADVTFVNLPFTLSLVLLLPCLNLIKLILLLLCLVQLKIHHRHQLFKCIVVFSSSIK